MKRSALALTLLASMVTCSSNVYSMDPADGVKSFSESSEQETYERVYTLEELCHYALEQSPRINARVSGVRAAQAEVSLEKSGIWPKSNVNANYTKTSETDLMRFGVRVDWDTDLNSLLRYDVELVRMGLLSAQEELHRERVWVLNDVADRYRAIAANMARQDMYDQIIDLVSSLKSEDKQFNEEKNLKLTTYKAERRRINNRITDLTSQLSALAFGNPYGNGVVVDPSFFSYRPLSFNRKAILRRAISERMYPEEIILRRKELQIKMATRLFEPSVFSDVEYWEVNGVAGQGHDNSNVSFRTMINLGINLNSREAKSAAREHLYETRSFVESQLNDLINNTKRAIDTFEFAQENVENFEQKPVDYFLKMSSVPVDRQYFNTLDLYIEQDSTRMDYLSAYFSAIFVLNRYVLVTPLEQHEYVGMHLDNTMPKIFEYLQLPDSTLDRHRRELLE